MKAGSTARVSLPPMANGPGLVRSSYSKEELVAEMGAAFLCARAGIVERTIDNSAAYVASWRERLKNDARLVVQAAAQAQRAADFILGRQYGAEESEAGQ